MPDHLHTIWTLPEGDADFSTRWGAIKARFTMSLRQNKREAAIWQRRFWEHHIRDEADYVAYVRCRWINPVKHGFVERAADWPFSSIHREIAHGLVEPEWSGSVPDGEFGE
jgi:putative transposase